MFWWEIDEAKWRFFTPLAIDSTPDLWVLCSARMPTAEALEDFQGRR